MSNEPNPYNAYGDRFRTRWWLKKGMQALDMYSNMQSISTHYQNPSDFPKEKHMYIPNTPTKAGKRRKKIGPLTKTKAYLYDDDIVMESPEVAGFKGTNALPKKMQKYGNGTVNSLAGRASMKRTTKKLKSKTVKKVYVPKKLKKQVNQILTGKELTGKYVTSRIGNIGVSNPGSNPNKASFTIYGVATRPAVFALQSDPSTYNYCSWFCPITLPTIRQATPTLSVATALNYDPCDALTFFHPAKFMDAASVLWNNKGINDIGWLTQTDNITTRIAAAGADPSHNRPSNVQFTIVNSFVEFELKNMSMRQVKIRIVTCTPKVKIQNNYPLNVVVDGIAADNAENGALAAPNSNADINNPLFNFRDSPSFTSQFKYDTVEVIIKAGETCKHSLQGPKNIKFDTQKYLVNELNGEQYNMMGTKSVILQVMADVQPKLLTLIPGHYHETLPAATDNYKLPIAVTRTETFILKCPATAGFLKNDEVDGEAQALNLKRRITGYGNFASYNAALVEYKGHDEEQPATAIAESLYF